MRFILTLVAFMLAAFPAAAQTDYETVADSTSLVDGGTLADVDISCMTQLPSGDFVFYNFPTGDLVTHDPDAAPGSRTTILRSNAQLDADVSSDVESCFAIEADGSSNVYAALQDSTNTDLVYKINASGVGLPTGTVLAEADGLTGIAVTGSTVYLARVAFFGAPEDGFYSINTTGTGQTPAVVITDPGLDLVDVEVGSDGSLYSSSSEFGAGAFDGAVVKVTDPAGTPALSVVYDPFGDGIFTNESDGGLEDLELASGSGADRLYLFNNSFAAPEGEQWGFVLADGTDGEQFASETAMIADADTDVEEYTPPGGRSMVLSGNDIFVASRSAFGGTDQIVRITGFPPVTGPNFDLTASGVPATVAQGGSFTVTFSVTNNTANAVTGDLFYTATPGPTRAQVFGNQTVAAGETRSGSYVQNVPGSAPPGVYTYTVRIGNFPNTTVDSEAFTITVTPAPAAIPSAEWTHGAVVWQQPELGAAARTSEVGAFPNPFARSTEIAFELDRASDVSLVIYDVRGREVATLADAAMEAGQHSVTFDAANLPSGVYVYRLVSGTQVETGRVTLVK